MRNERGIAMLIALIVAIVLSLMCLSLTFSSLQDFQVSTEFESHEKALLVADAGFNEAKQSLRGQDIDDLLAGSTTVSLHTTDPSRTLPEWANRNPISPFEARNVDYMSQQTGGNPTTIKGFLTPATGETVGDCGTLSNPRPCGRYFARLTDNNDGDGDTEKDTDGTVYLRVLGIHPNSIVETGSRKNAVAILEAELHRDTSFKMTSPLSLLSQQITANFDGNSFLIDGYDHTGMTLDDFKHPHNDTDLGLTPFSGISCLYDNPGLGDATAAVNNINTALTDNQDSNVIGKGVIPSVNDDTLLVKNSGDPDSTNVFNPAFLVGISNQLAAVADYKYPTGTDTDTRFSGGEILGTPSAPKITYVKGNLDISGTSSGAGILLVTGDLSGNGGFDFEGLVLVLGSGKLYFGGANKTFLGGILIANLTGTPPTFGTANIDIRGQSNFFFAGDRIELAVSLLPMRTVSWREITPEIEPVQAATP